MKYASRSIFVIVLLLIALAILAAPAWATNPKLAATGTYLTVSDDLVVTSVRTAGTARWVYAEKADQTYGILIRWTDTLPSIGDTISSLFGAITTNSDDERVFWELSATVTATNATVEPLRLNGKAIGGGDWNYNSQTGAGQIGATNRSGLNNVGMKVEVTGEVVSYDSSTWTVWLDDTPNDGNDPYIPVIQYPGTLTVSQWESSMAIIGSARVTGVVTLRTSGGVRTAYVESPGWNYFEQEPSTTSITIPTDTVDDSWNLIAIPYQAVEPDPANVLDVSYTALVDKLSGWNGYTQGTTLYDPEWGGELTSFEIGNGYWLNYTCASTTYDAYVSSSPTWVSTATAGWHLIGNPSTTTINWADVQVTNGSVVKTMEQARDAGWVNSVTMGYEDDALFNMGLESDWESINTLEPWHGYWFQTYVDDIALIIPGN